MVKGVPMLVAWLNTLVAMLSAGSSLWKCHNNHGSQEIARVFEVVVRPVTVVAMLVATVG